MLFRNNAFTDLHGHWVACTFTAMKDWKEIGSTDDLPCLMLCQVFQHELCRLVKRRSVKQKSLRRILAKEVRGLSYQHHIFLHGPIQHIAYQRLYSQFLPCSHFFTQPLQKKEQLLILQLTCDRPHEPNVLLAASSQKETRRHRGLSTILHTNIHGRDVVLQ